MEHMERTNGRRMVRIGAWIAPLLCLMLYWVSEAGWLPGPFDKAPEESMIPVTLIFTSVLCLIGALLSMLLALFPMKNIPYWERFIRRLPFGVLLVLAIGTFFSLSSAYMWSVNGVRQVGSDEFWTTAPEADCRTVQEGIFMSYADVIVRSGSLQVERDHAGTRSDTLEVEWLRDCMYELVDRQDRTQSVVVNINDVGPDWIVCTAQFEGAFWQYRMRRMPSGSRQVALP